MNILIIEPSRSYSELISGLLDCNEVASTVASSAKQALDILQHSIPDSICVAHHLGDMNSTEFIKFLNKHSICLNTPKFLISSEDSDEFRRKSFDSGYTDIFSKKDITILQRALRSMMLHITCNIKARILYVEDVPSTAAYTKSIMSDVGWDVVHVDTGEQALDQLNTEKFDLVITDLILPGDISGMSLINIIRERSSEEDCPTPVLALSGWNDLLRQVFVLQQGASDFISKPFQEIDFLARALNLIQNKKSMEISFTEKQILHDKAHTDNLTGLYNRHALDEYAKKLFHRTFQQHSSLSILLIDIDHFKKINDAYGHAVGDIVLSHLGSVISRSCRENDMAIRFGGEEFVIVFPGCNKKDAIKKAECLRSDIEALHPKDILVTISIGLTCLKKGQSSELDIMLKTADKALYQAKELGRNQICVMDLE